MRIPAGPPTREPTPFHFDASRVGKPILDVPSPVPTARHPPRHARHAGRRAWRISPRAPSASDDEIAVTNLQHAYGYYVDRKMWDDVADLFATDGTMEIGLQGVYAGQHEHPSRAERSARDSPKARSTITFICRPS